VRLGFACGWENPPQPTWSYTPWNLRAALIDRVDLVDLGINFPLPVRVGLKAACARRHRGQWVSMWRHSRSARWYGETVLTRAAGHRPVDVVLEIQDLASFGGRPYLLYQDLSYDVLLERADEPGGLSHFPTLSRDAVLRLRDRQRSIYAGAAGVLAMSRWFADHLIEVSGVPADRVHVVHPGASALDRPGGPAGGAAAGAGPGGLAGGAGAGAGPGGLAGGAGAGAGPGGLAGGAGTGAGPGAVAMARRQSGSRRRLLFVGRDFHTKAGEVVVAATALLRRDVDPAITLTVVGPSGWPLPGAIPPGVDFRGRLPVDVVAGLYDEHDLFVLPSRFEGFGISFVEALAHGLPCVGRRAFAMPEIVTPGVNGDLVDGDDPADLAGRIAALLADDALYDRVGAAAGEVFRHYSWGRAADDVLAVAHAVVR
jgi:glycosyltransferase involved in cell wall biosynthesis